MMTTSETQPTYRWTRAAGLRWFLILMLICGICFRFIEIGHKIYWHDEAYTTLRSAGYTRYEIDNELFQNRFVPAPELQKFQRIKPNSTIADTIWSLEQEDPQHPPLYYVMTRFWMQLWGSSIGASRSIAALISLLTLPLMYALAMALFNSKTTALLATTLLALSPFDLLYAQTARQYSLLSVMILGGSWLLVRVMQRDRSQPFPKWSWLGYGLFVALGFYAHPFFLLTSLAHVAYVLGLTGSDHLLKPAARLEQLKAWVRDRRIWGFVLANGLALLLFSPWILIFLERHQQAVATTGWTTVHLGMPYLIKLWLLNLTSLFFDLDFGFENPINFLIRLPFLLLVMAALYQVYRRASRSASLFIFTSAWLPFLLLVIPDLVLGGRRSSVSRYLISCYPAIQLAVAYFLSLKLATGKKFWQAVLVLCIVSSLLSNTISAMADTWWVKDLSYQNGKVALTLNAEAATKPVVLSDIGDDFTNTGDLLSLSYRLDPNIRLYLVGNTPALPPDLGPLVTEPSILVFRPSQSLRTAIAQQGWQLVPVHEDARLWRIRK